MYIYIYTYIYIYIDTDIDIDVDIDTDIVTDIDTDIDIHIQIDRYIIDIKIYRYMIHCCKSRVLLVQCSVVPGQQKRSSDLPMPGLR